MEALPIKGFVYEGLNPDFPVEKANISYGRLKCSGQRAFIPGKPKTILVLTQSVSLCRMPIFLKASLAKTLSWLEPP